MKHISFSKIPQLEFIKCDDYNVGHFTPVSFEPRLKWSITKSEFIKSYNKLSKFILFEAKLGRHDISVASSPYSYGMFSARCKGIGFSVNFYGSGIHDPEEALYLTEQRLRDRFNWKIKHYKNLLSKVELIDL
jgi:hypothetical protein